MLGDGNLHYPWEHLAELFYSAEWVKTHVFLTGACQLLVNPVCNLDRQGPVHIFSSGCTPGFNFLKESLCFNTG